MLTDENRGGGAEAGVAAPSARPIGRPVLEDENGPLRSGFVNVEVVSVFSVFFPPYLYNPTMTEISALNGKQGECNGAS